MAGKADTTSAEYRKRLARQRVAPFKPRQPKRVHTPHRPSGHRWKESQQGWTCLGGHMIPETIDGQHWYERYCKGGLFVARDLACLLEGELP